MDSEDEAALDDLLNKARRQSGSRYTLLRRSKAALRCVMMKQEVKCADASSKRTERASTSQRRQRTVAICHVDAGRQVLSIADVGHCRLVCACAADTQTFHIDLRSAYSCRGEKRVKFEEEEGEEEDDSGEAEDIHYKDFFDPAQQAPADAALQDASGDATSHHQGLHDVIRPSPIPELPAIKLMQAFQGARPVLPDKISSSRSQSLLMPSPGLKPVCCLCR